MEQVVSDAIGSIGERIVLARSEAVNVENGHIGSYLHSDGKKGALIVAEGGSDESIKTRRAKSRCRRWRCARRISAAKHVPEHVTEAEKEIYRKQAADEGKPAGDAGQDRSGRL